jgi:hypothetical protein
MGSGSLNCIAVLENKYKDDLNVITLWKYSKNIF